MHEIAITGPQQSLEQDARTIRLGADQILSLGYIASEMMQMQREAAILPRSRYATLSMAEKIVTQHRAQFPPRTGDDGRTERAGKNDLLMAGIFHTE